MPQSINHGIGEVFIDGVLVGETDTYRAYQNQQKQSLAFSRSNLGEGEHTIRIVVTGRKSAGSEGGFVSVDAFNVPTAVGGDGQAAFARIPQKADTHLTIHGRDALSVVADLKLGSQEIMYSTSEIVSFHPSGGRDVLYVNGNDGDPGEMVLRYDSRPTVALSGGATSVWDEASSTLRLNYLHGSGVGATITGGGRPGMRVDVAGRSDMATFWKTDGALSGRLLTTVVKGPDLVRGVTYAGATAHLTGGMDAAGTVTAYLPPAVTAAIWNGTPMTVTGGVATIAAPGPATTPSQTLNFVRMADQPEAQPQFDDSDWTRLTRTSTLNPRQGPGNQGVILDSNAYGAYEGDVWYRVSYTAAQNITSVALTGNGGLARPNQPAGSTLPAAGLTASHMLVWVNGTYVGAKPTNGQSQTFSVPAGVADAGDDVVVSVLHRNLGQNLDWSNQGENRQNRGLRDATLGNVAGTAVWRMQGALGFEPEPTPADAARDLYNNGGTSGERAGWHLPGYPTSEWQAASNLLVPRAGHMWFRSTFSLDVAATDDPAFVVRINSSRLASKSDRSRVVIYINGWNTGIYAGNIGPQNEFTIPRGFLNLNGVNSIALSVTAEIDGAGPDTVSIHQVGAQTGALAHVQNAAPSYEASPEPTPTPTPTPSPTPSPTSPVPTTPAPTRTADPTPTVPTPTKPAEPPYKYPVSRPYTEPGEYVHNGRRWRTSCEQYSQTERCRTDIWATVVNGTGTTYTRTTGWAFNNLTYLPYMTRAAWKANPLGGYAQFGFNDTFTGTDGVAWRTECDSSTTGKNACRSYRMTTVYDATPRAAGGYPFSQSNQWVFNNVVLFGDPSWR